MLPRILRRSVAPSSAARLIRAKASTSGPSDPSVGTSKTQAGEAVNPSLPLRSDVYQPPLARTGHASSASQHGSEPRSSPVAFFDEPKHQNRSPPRRQSFGLAAAAPPTTARRPNERDLSANIRREDIALFEHVDFAALYGPDNPHPMTAVSASDPNPGPLPEDEWLALPEPKRLRLLKKARFAALTDEEQVAWRTLGPSRIAATRNWMPAVLPRGGAPPGTWAASRPIRSRDRSAGLAGPSAGEEGEREAGGGAYQARTWNTTLPPEAPIPHILLRSMKSRRSLHRDPITNGITFDPIDPSELDPHDPLLPPLDSSTTLDDWCALTPAERKVEWARANDAQQNEWRALSWKERQVAQAKDREMQQERFKGLTGHQKAVKRAWDQVRREAGLLGGVTLVGGRAVSGETALAKWREEKKREKEARERAKESESPSEEPSRSAPAPRTMKGIFEEEEDVPEEEIAWVEGYSSPEIKEGDDSNK